MLILKHHSIRFLLLLASLLGTAGCASITNPVANGVPARLLPDELLAEPREVLKPIPLTWLQTTPPEVYTLDTGDIIGVYIEGILGEEGRLPPINYPDAGDLPPSFGFPIPVREDGSVPLPQVRSVEVKGLSIQEAQDAIFKAYTDGETEFLTKEGARIIVTLVRPRRSRILVVREDSSTQRGGVSDPGFRLVTSANITQQPTQGTGSELELPTTEADVLSALVRSGGLPGPNATNEVIIYRGYNSIPGMESQIAWSESRNPKKGEPRTIRIPLRLPANSEKPFSADDVKLENGDIIFVPARDSDVYYTGGMLPAREAPIPRDYDIRVVEAVLRVGGPILSGGQLTNNFNGNNLNNGLGRPNPSLLTVLRKAPNGGQIAIRVDLNLALRDSRENIIVKEGDVLLLQETPSEAVARYVAQQFGITAFANVFSRGSVTANASAAAP